MRDENWKKSKLTRLIRKWFNIKCKSNEVAASGDFNGGEDAWRSISLESEQFTVKKSRTERSPRMIEQSLSESYSSSRAYLDHPQIINIQNYSLFVSTWNVGGKSPNIDMNLDNWLHSAPHADIYVLGFQEIVPLNVENILGAEDNGPGKKWLTLINRSLNNTSTSNGMYEPSPIPDPVAEWNADFEGLMDCKASSFFPRCSFQGWRTGNDASASHSRRYSVCDKVMFGHRASDYSQRPSDYSSSRRPSDYSFGQRASDFSRLGSDEDVVESPSMVLYSPRTLVEDAVTVHRYCLVASKQMVGVFLTVWVRSELRDRVRNVKFSCVGRGLRGYLGNKGSVSMSMLLRETTFCFVCSHLTSGQRPGDELRRNADFTEIIRKTRFPRVEFDTVRELKSPETILEHDRIIWLGDLNYRIALPYRSAKALIEMQNWRALVDKDQLRREQSRGRVFDGWREGKIYFPPTYKYSNNSDRYAGDETHPKEKRRTPAWCDRILWYGNGIQQLSYVRGESRFSDHRPVSSLFWVEIESVSDRLRKSMSCSSSKFEVEELLPSSSNGYTEFCF